MVKEHNSNPEQSEMGSSPVDVMQRTSYGEYMKIVSTHRFNEILIRYSEIGLKSLQVRERMERNLINSIRIQLRKYGIKERSYYNEPGRIFFIFRPEDIAAAGPIILGVSGVRSISPVFKTSPELNAVFSACASYARPFIAPKMSLGIHLKILNRERFGNTPVNEIAKKCAAKVFGLIPPEERGVYNLSTPDLKIFIEIREKYAYIYHYRLETSGSALPIEDARLCFAEVLDRPQDFSAILRIMGRGQHILPVIFETKSNRNSKKFAAILSALKSVYPVEHFYVIRINFDAVCEGIYRQLGADEKKYMCFLCRYFRHMFIDRLRTRYKEFFIRQRHRIASYRVSSNIIHVIPSSEKRRKSFIKILEKLESKPPGGRPVKHFARVIRRPRALVTGDSLMEGVYCPLNEDFIIFGYKNIDLVIPPNLLDDPTHVNSIFREFIEREIIIREVIASNITPERDNTQKNEKNSEYPLTTRPNLRKMRKKAAILKDLLTELENCGFMPEFCEYKSDPDGISGENAELLIKRIGLKNLVNSHLKKASLIRIL